MRATWQDAVNHLSGRESQGWEGKCCNKHQHPTSRNLPRCRKLALHLTKWLLVLRISWKCCFEPTSAVYVHQTRSEHTLLGHFIPKAIIFWSGHTWLLTGFLSYQRLGFLLVFVIVQPIPSQNKPATVPRFDESPLLPEPAAPDDTRASVHLALTSSALGAAVVRALLVHHGSSDLRKQAKLVGNLTKRRCCSTYDTRQLLVPWYLILLKSPQHSGGSCCCSGPAAFSLQRAVSDPTECACFKQPTHPDEDQMMLPAAEQRGKCSQARLWWSKKNKKTTTTHHKYACLACLYACSEHVSLRQNGSLFLVLHVRHSLLISGCVLLDLVWEKSGQVSQSFKRKFSILTPKPSNVYSCISAVCPSRHWAGVKHPGLDTSEHVIHNYTNVVTQLRLSECYSSL